MPGKTKPARCVIRVLLPDIIGFQGAAGRRGGMVTPGLSDPVGKIVGAGGDICSVEVRKMLFIPPNPWWLVAVIFDRFSKLSLFIGVRLNNFPV